jgi:hypothetical protein
MILGLVGAVLSLFMSTTMAMAATPAGSGEALAPTCSASYLRPGNPIVQGPDDRYRPYDYRLWGQVRISNPSAAAGCIVRVCLAEELGEGNWQAFWCANSAVAANEPVYLSLRVFLDCQNYAGTGYFRSYARFQNSTVSVMGPERYVCT